MYLNVIQFAESFGVEENVVEGWVRNVLLRGAKDVDIFNGLAAAETSLGKGGQK
jgi:hypothetical protein